MPRLGNALLYDQAGPLSEWERATWYPPGGTITEWQIINSGQFSKHVDEVNTHQDEHWVPRNCKLRPHEANLTPASCRSNLKPARPVCTCPATSTSCTTLLSRRKDWSAIREVTDGLKAARRSTTNLFIRSLAASVSIDPIRTRCSQRAVRQWSAPTYSFAVCGHWRTLADPSQEGHDSEGNKVFGKTSIREFAKYKDLAALDDMTTEKRDPKVVIGVKQTLGFARDVIRSYQTNQHKSVAETHNDTPSDEWMACERSKLSAGLRYAILKRDNFACCLCGRSASRENGVKLEVDHIVPVNKWGRTVEDNLQTLCRDCNKGKSDRAC